jgi:hypothetical protein
MTEVELRWLSTTAAALPPSAIWVEVGTWMGKSWSCVALSLPVWSLIIAVDTFDGGAQDDEPRRYVAEHGKQSVIDQFNRVRGDVLRQRPDIHDQVVTLQSISAASETADGIADVVFIDGDHRTDAVLADIAAWAPKVKPGGLLCGHDGNDPKVIEAICQIAPPIEHMEPEKRGSIWIQHR